MDWTPENNRIQTMHLTGEELAEMKSAKHGWMKTRGFSGWFPVQAPDWHPEAVYRAKPAPVTQDVVPWEAIAEGWNWFARDADGEGYLYAEKPKPDADEFFAVLRAPSICKTDHIFAITPGTCDWRDSLQQRPQPAATGAVTEPLNYGDEYYAASPLTEGWFQCCIWDNHAVDRRVLSRGLVFLTEAAAVAHAKRMTGGV